MVRPSAAASRPSIEQLLDQQLCDFDALLAEVRDGIRNSTHFDDLESRASAIGTGMRAAFREGRRR